MTSVAVIVVAAGSGTRLGADVPKAFVTVAGRPLLAHAIDAVPDDVQLVIVAPATRVQDARHIAPGATVVTGAHTRQGSVAAGLREVGAGIRTVLVHDAARAFTPREVFSRVIDAVESTGGGVIPVLPVVDTIKRVDGTTVLETVDRSVLAQVQTPQGFPRDALEAAYASAADDHTDDAALVAASGGSVSTVVGDARAFKITTPADLRRAEQEWGAEMTGEIRTGIGVDVHAYDAGEPLWLGGLYWPDEVGLSGHSDGDAMCHAICDALLSAAGLGDIGSKFGTDDPRFAGAHGDVFIRETVALVEGAGFTVNNVAVQLIANGPRLGARRTELESHLTSLVGAPVSVSATTSDGLGFTGKGEGVAVIANALLSKVGQ
ncbi:2-C-methyl-D-erythritol 4-phosphate cytidylyltransferase/2-C-methyl-D-erythritol 2,4-cyclodiphosphate synthase [Microbacteriaceae bacterium SG_E_30_P1]|uniref:Bifunctional enzyme IspD/IspF n=1 Tax=Antiquaquibacter oligotrophicus TaxID=2880260 RepID=A0ABT6KJH6_9MICO|nr:2-C-methyl-D-erythritol 4-phosphate cytidylyltransferase [Antiquaquibacter oligotrophicus]MDH6180103.1 2-C-methyl-D-erythritol 4-phosphate cytidylyltransferase/2-C-methyl-D-erythritol 2,4-cyclodiphosphate synthase [Antiquaquibacter oligotrophicus]UDF14146.1 2-C-methyl-D-erythritol 4-phosphate cytidylyltransferase [Antiquaquibacter oligotrophicus]